VVNREPIPGTHEPGFVEAVLVEIGDGGSGVRDMLQRLGAKGVKFFEMGECGIIVARERAAIDESLLWHLTISCPDRHPTWDEIKTARYRLLPPDRCFGLLLPPPEFYVNVPAQDHVFHLWEITDPREPWSAL
jgi:hypothetical protein